jgi:hypothetical protein
MMKEVSFDDLVSAVARVQHVPKAKAHLNVAVAPRPFASPPLIIGEDDPFGAEVILIEASAAVGKSTMARHLSAFCAAPLLDLSTVPVSTGTLKSLVSDMDGKDEPIAAFHAGEIPIIVDSLDEGRLLSGETGFESFLQTMGEFLLQDRSVTNRPKLVLLGRQDSIKDAGIWLELAAEGVTVRSISVGYFGEKEARALIDSYALANAPEDCAYRKHPGPARQLIDAYFNAIGAAVGAPNGQLWGDPQGKSFAGYAPILAALGSLLARIDNFKDVANRLAAQGRQEAWSVIETVLDEILKREQKKLCEKLRAQLTCSLPDEAYDPHEQLTFLTRRLHNEPAVPSSRVKLPPSEQVKYHTMVEQYINEHPFVRQGRPTNAVLGSLVLVHAITNNLLKDRGLELLADLSQQPFIWRFVRTRAGHLGELPLKGDFIGYVLNSYWNDPNMSGGGIRIRSKDGGSANVAIPTGGGDSLAVTVTLPIRYYSQMRGCDLQVKGCVSLEGRSAKGSGSAFFMHGRSTVVVETLEVLSDSLTIDGILWMQADVIKASARLALHARQDAEVGWGGKLAESYPWSRVPPTLAPPPTDGESDVLTVLLDRCASRLPDRVLVILDDYTFSDTENRWVARDFAHEFPQLLRLLIKHKLATAETFGTYAQNKYRIHLNTTWASLRHALDVRAEDQRIAAFVEEARRSFGHA